VGEFEPGQLGLSEAELGDEPAVDAFDGCVRCETVPECAAVDVGVDGER
jgi:hypothetical protein